MMKKSVLWLFGALIVLISSAPAQGLSQEQLLMMMQNEMAQQMMNGANMSGMDVMNSGNKQGASSNPSKSGSILLSGSDSSLLTYPDSALAMPILMRRLDSLDSLAQKDTIPPRYSQQIFYGEKASLFSSTTNRVGTDYPIKAGDQLWLSMWGDVEKQEKLAVSNRGTIFVEGVGSIGINGSTLAEAEKKIKKRLSRSYNGLRSGRIKMALRLESLSPMKVFILGEAKVPGGYVFHGNTSVLLAMYFAQGPGDLGSVREMELTRDGKKIKIDLYDFLFGKELEKHVILMDGDILYLPPAQKLVKIEGAIGRSAIYELKEGETIADLLRYAGGIQPNAANQSLVIERHFDDGRKDYITAKSARSYSDSSEKLELVNGDVVHIPVSTIDPRNNITVIGAVNYPGSYEFSENMNVYQAIQLAGGLRKEAFKDRIQILRSSPQGRQDLYSDVLKEQGGAMALQASDTLIVYSQAQLFPADSVAVSGAIRTPGLYPFHKGMTAKDLVLMGGGFLPSRLPGQVRLERMVKGSSEIEVQYLKLDGEYQSTDHKVLLKEYDRLVIPEDPDYYRHEVVRLSGLFLNPGEYSLKHTNERLKDLIDRSGGLRSWAYIDGARFYRRVTIQDTVEIKDSDSTEIVPKDSIYQIGLDLELALAGNAMHNIILQDGDSVYVPRQKAAIKVSGEVGAPGHVLFRAGENLDYYIERAGGFTRLSDEEHVYIVYANGEKADQFSLPRDPDAGAEIFIPKKAAVKETDWLRVMSTVATILSSFAATALAISQIK